MDYASPHPTLTTRFDPAEDSSTDDNVAILRGEEEVGGVQIARAIDYGVQLDAFMACVQIDPDTFQHGPERRSYAAAAADVVAILKEHGLGGFVQ